MNKLLLSLAAVAAFTFTAAAETTDVINQAATGVKDTNYKEGKITTTNSGAEYAFLCAGDKAWSSCVQKTAIPALSPQKQVVKSRQSKLTGTVKQPTTAC